MLALPVLAGSAAYAVAELFHWRASLEHKPEQAPKFYGVLVVATIAGICLSISWVSTLSGLCSGLPLSTVSLQSRLCF
jgi:hypothetical protein